MTKVLALQQMQHVSRATATATNCMACLIQHTCKTKGIRGNLSCIDEDSTGVPEEVSRLADDHGAMHPQSRLIRTLLNIRAPEQCIVHTSKMLHCRMSRATQLTSSA